MQGISARGMHSKIQRLTVGNKGVQGVTGADSGTHELCTGADKRSHGVQGMTEKAQGLTWKVTGFQRQSCFSTFKLYLIFKQFFFYYLTIRYWYDCLCSCLILTKLMGLIDSSFELISMKVCVYIAVWYFDKTKLTCLFYHLPAPSGFFSATISCSLAGTLPEKKDYWNKMLH